MSRSSLTTLSLSFIIISGCQSLPVKTPVEPVSIPVPTPPPAPVVSPVVKASPLIRLAPEQYPDFSDDASTSALKTAALRSAVYFRSLPAAQLFQLAQDTYTARDIAEGVEHFATLLDSADWTTAVKNEFVVYQSVGKDDTRAVTFSSYYEPTVQARWVRDKDYRYPIYGRPKDLIDVDLGLFDAAWQGGRIAGRREGQRLVPYYTRDDIDGLGALKEQNLEIAWAKDPLDIFFLQIEGSGWLDVGHGQMVRIRFDGHNGRKFGSVGQYLIQSGRVKKEGFSHQGFIRYMHEHATERQKLLNINPRYVFFKIDTSSAGVYAYGNIDVALTPGRSIATDPKLFPKGFLAFVDIEGKRDISHSSTLHRFVLNQDEGGAIQGPARVDFFSGHGADAETFAFQLWNPGRLYFLVRKRPS